MADVESSDAGQLKNMTADAVNVTTYVKEEPLSGSDDDDEIIVVCEQQSQSEEHQQVNNDDRPSFASDDDENDDGTSSSGHSASDDEQEAPMFRGFEHLDIRNSQYTKEMVGKAAAELQAKIGQLFRGFQRRNNVAAVKLGCTSPSSGWSGSRVVVVNGAAASNGDDKKPSKKLLLAAVKQRLNSSNSVNGITVVGGSRSLVRTSSTFVVPNIKAERPSSSSSYDGERPEWKQRTWQPNEHLRPIFSPLQAWEYFMNDSMLNDMVRFTNEDAASTSVRITLAELKAVFAILYATCVYDERRFSPERFFSPSGGTAIDLCAALMPYKRFRMILTHLKLTCRKKVTVVDQQQQQRSDPLAPVRDVLNTFLINCRSNYRLGGELVIREKVQFFRGKCDFVRDRHKVKGVKTKCGMRLFCLVDASNGYVYNAAVSTGDKEPFGTERYIAATNETVKQLLRPIYGSGRVVVTDENLTDISLCSDLFKDYRLKTIGAIRKNRCPPDIHRLHLSDVHVLPSFSSRFVTGEYVTFVAYVPRRGEVVRVVSTAHRGKEIDPNSGNLKRPRIVSDYNRIVAGVSAFYEREKLPDRKAVSWPVGVLYSLLDIALLNSYVLYRGRRDNETIVDFAQQLALLLAKDFMIERLNKLRSSSLSIPDVESKHRLARLAQTFDDRIQRPAHLGDTAITTGSSSDDLINPEATGSRCDAYSRLLERPKSTALSTVADAEKGRCRQLARLSQTLDDGTAVALTVSVSSDDLNAMIRGRCDVCPRSRDRKTKFRCIFCGIRVCGEHSLVICERCNFHKKCSSPVRLTDTPPPPPPASSDSESEVLQV